MTELHTERAPTPKAPDWGVYYGLDDLWSEILPGLWVGGTGDRDTIAHAAPSRNYRGELMPIDGHCEIGPEHFDAVVTMYAWARPVGWNVEEYRYGIYDADGVDPETIFDIDKLRDCVAWAAKRWQSGERVLIRCQAGLNRSGLIATLVMIREGWEPSEAIAKLREGRCYKSLFNASFEQFVRGVDVEYWRE